MNIKTNGIELDVYSNEDEHLGDLYISKTEVIWCKGKTIRANGVAKQWSDFIALMEASK